jgi:predicted nucleic acid-binding protein
VTLIDSNVFMYAAGRGHAFKKRAAKFLEKVAQGSFDAVIDAEVLQEILHRYRALVPRAGTLARRMVGIQCRPANFPGGSARHH